MIKVLVFNIHFLKLYAIQRILTNNRYLRIRNIQDICEQCSLVRHVLLLCCKYNFKKSKLTFDRKLLSKILLRITTELIYRSGIGFCHYKKTNRFHFLILGQTV